MVNNIQLPKLLYYTFLYDFSNGLVNNINCRGTIYIIVNFVIIVIIKKINNIWLTIDNIQKNNIIRLIKKYLVINI